jgi:hypothetical protein
MSSAPGTTDALGVYPMDDMERFRGELAEWRAAVAWIYIPVQMSQVMDIIRALTDATGDMAVGYGEWLAGNYLVMASALFGRQGRHAFYNEDYRRGMAAVIRGNARVLSNPSAGGRAAICRQLLNIVGNCANDLMALGLCKPEPGAPRS